MNSLEDKWETLIENIDTPAVRSYFKILTTPAELSKERIVILFNNDTALESSMQSELRKNELLQAVHKIFPNDNPKIIFDIDKNYPINLQPSDEEINNIVKTIDYQDFSKEKIGNGYKNFILYHFLPMTLLLIVICFFIVAGILFYTFDFISNILNLDISNEQQEYIVFIISAYITGSINAYVSMKKDRINLLNDIKEKCVDNNNKLTDKFKNYIKSLEYNTLKTKKDYLSFYRMCDIATKDSELIKKDFFKLFKNASEFISDFDTYEYETMIKHLTTKKRPAIKKAEDIKELKQKTKEYLKQYKLMRYEYDMLFSLFPELENYIEYYSCEKQETIEDVKENFDYVRSWVSKEEYEDLGEDERNQLALDRYISSRSKSKWAIGRDYEMYIGYEYEQKGYAVTYTGITDRLEDKGRDLIAQKGDEVLIIQCKNWSKYKEIHENHICQLFGTTIQYNIENPTLFKARPVFITSATLSETAMKFAQYLNVEVIQNKKFEEFPRIKCNIGNNNEKIYHLPFDQQYDRTIIGDQKGEFFAWTVQEAVEHGFRRAKKYFYAKK